MLFGDKMRKNGAAGRPVEGTHNAEQHKYHVNCYNRLCLVEGKQEQQKEARAKAGIAQNQDFAAVENICNVSRDEKENDAGKELREANKTEVERALGDFVDLPADGDGLHFHGEHDETARRLKNRERGVAERSPRVVARVYAFGL